jgi:hypothetical protein
MAKDYVLEMMKEEKLPMTREQYLALAYMGNPPEPLSAEEEAELPEQFQLDEDDEDENEAGLNALAE